MQPGCTRRGPARADSASLEARRPRALHSRDASRAARPSLRGNSFVFEPFAPGSVRVAGLGGGSQSGMATAPA